MCLNNTKASTLFILFFAAKQLKRMKKYSKITKEQILDLFKFKQVINRKDVTTKYGCSVYAVRKEIDDLVDSKKIKITNYGYRLW